MASADVLGNVMVSPEPRLTHLTVRGECLMATTRRSLLAGAAALAGPSVLPHRADAVDAKRSRLFTPEMFGAKGDGVTNDSAAMAALAKAVNENGGGTVKFRRTTYKIGRQVRAAQDDVSYFFEPVKLLEFSGCRTTLKIVGNGARLKCAEGLRYGVFAADGTPARHPAPYIGPGLATPYRYMIRIADCTGAVEVSDLELDGSNASLVIGGTYGDTGWQIPAIGLALVDNHGAEIVRNVYTHHHGEDGFYIDGVPSSGGPAPRREIADLRSEYNGRQGCSIVGGHGYRFERCRFNHTGKAGVASFPGAGVDIEAEGGKTNRDLRFVDCEFADSYGCGMVADTGDSADVSFTRCSFVGTTNWAAWPCKPGFRFDDCSFVGPLVRAFGDADPARATQLSNCRFLDDPSLSPTGKIYPGENPDRPLADLSDASNILFSKCSFLARHDGTLPWSVGAIYEDCTMEQKSPLRAYPRGTYRGRTIINGNVDLSGSRIVGELIVNGRRYAAADG
jgi:hypothetical protein